MKRVALILIWLSLCAFTKVQDQASAILTATGLTSTTIVLPSVVAGNTILACVHTGGATFTLTDNNGGVYTNVLNAANGIGIYMAPAHPGGNTTVTISTTSTGAFLSGVAAEINGLNAAPTFDTNGGTGTYATRTVIQTGTLTPSSATSRFVFGCGFTDTIQTPSGLINYGSGGGSPTALTNQGQTSSGGGETIVGAFEPAASTSTFGFQWTTTTGGTLGGVVAIIPSIPPVLGASVCPNGAGVPGVCDLGEDTWGNILNYYKCPASTNCTMVVSDSATCPAAGGTPTGGSPGHPCAIGWNGSAWVTD